VGSGPGPGLPEDQGPREGGQEVGLGSRLAWVGCEILGMVLVSIVGLWISHGPHPRKFCASM
jgi:hypothetical protein